MTNGISNGMTKKQKELTKVIFAAILAALALVVGYIEFRWPVAPWLKLDFSEVIILVSFILIAFNHTLGVIIIRSVIRWLVSSDSTNVPFPFFGETVAIIASVVLVLVYMLIRKLLLIKDYNKTSENGEDKSKISKIIIREIIAIVVVTLIMTIFMVTINFFVVTPSFASQGQYPFFKSFVESGKYDRMIGGAGVKNYTIFVVSIYSPFNLLKFASCLTLFTLIKKPLTDAINLQS